MARGGSVGEGGSVAGVRRDQWPGGVSGQRGEGSVAGVGRGWGRSAADAPQGAVGGGKHLKLSPESIPNLILKSSPNLSLKLSPKSSPKLSPNRAQNQSQTEPNPNPNSDPKLIPNQSQNEPKLSPKSSPHQAQTRAQNQA